MAENTSAITLEMIGMDETAFDSLKSYITTDQFFDAKFSCQKWIDVGNVIKRIKVAKRTHKIKGKLPELINEFFGHELKKDEIATSQKLADNEQDVLKWFVNTGCNRTTPRAIWSEYNKGEKSEKKTPYEKCEKIVESLFNTIDKNFPYLSLEERKDIVGKLALTKRDIDDIFADQMARIRREYHDLVQSEEKEKAAKEKIAAMADKMSENEEVEKLAKTG